MLNEKFKYFPFVVICFLCISISCTSNINNTSVSDNLLISPFKLDSLLKNADTSVIVFWADWCSASKDMIKEVFKPAHDSITNQALHNKVIFIIADDNFDPAILIEHRRLGMNSYYLPNSGKNAIANRKSIKKFIYDCYPNNKINWLGFNFGIPATLLISPHNIDILNEDDSSESVAFLFRNFFNK